MRSFRSDSAGWNVGVRREEEEEEEGFVSRSGGGEGSPGGAGGRQEGRHFSCARGCTRDDNGKAGQFLVELLKKDLTFANCVCVQTSTRRSAGPLAGPTMPTTGSEKAVETQGRAVKKAVETQ